MKVEISRGLLEQIMDFAAAEPGEVCGLLLGEAGLIEAVLPAANVAPDPTRHFELDPVSLLRAHRAARQGGPAILGHYHSHPSGVAVPSATDAACAAPDGTLWLIIATGQARLWVAKPGGVAGVGFVEALLDIR
ncbi:M67 family metallopeptidase [Sphingobium sp. AP49]|uniref:M67 family metallopeptidase n=1 Tax=Sphingobium sp. AP49 TaxID=1144307 RepID=UPI00056633F9|nr:M67 family metallopeptidase [Sphingobium sp. AP49]WHO40797.1 M67 family metallopeptidase [Sphingobium sp. AP49]